MGVTEKVSIEQERKNKAAQYQKLLRTPDGEILQDPFQLSNWRGEEVAMQHWPKIFLEDMTAYLLSVEDKKLGKQLMSDYKARKHFKNLFKVHFEKKTQM